MVVAICAVQIHQALARLWLVSARLILIRRHYAVARLAVFVADLIIAVIVRIGSDCVSVEWVYHVASSVSGQLASV